MELQGTRILNGVSLDVRSGETVGIIGPNGSGKTTLFNCLSGFLSCPDGKVIFQGEDITRTAPYVRAKLGIGRVFQNFGIFREMTVVENMITAIESRQSLGKLFFPWGKLHRENKKVAMQYLAEVRLDSKANEKASSLSGGQMRLLEIIRTLAFGAQLFLLDEPTAGVSPKMKEEIAELIRRLKQRGMTVLVIEHDINFIQSFCERIVVLDVGRVVLEDTPDKVRSNELLKEIYFGRGK